MLSIVAVFCTVRPMSRTTITRQVVTMRVMPRAVRFTLLQGEGGIGTHSLTHSHTHTLTPRLVTYFYLYYSSLTHSLTHTLTDSLTTGF